MPIPIFTTNPTKFKVAFGTGHVITTSIFLYATVTLGTTFGVGPSFNKYKNKNRDYKKLRLYFTFTTYRLIRFIDMLKKNHWNIWEGFFFLQYVSRK
mgnify:CR=1 FL=1